MASLVALLLAPVYAAYGGFGQHFPHGQAAVAYLYGPDGMWRDQSGLQFEWGYRDDCATSAHPANLPALLLRAAEGNTTAPDADCLLLSDLGNDGEIHDDIPSGHAFHEHGGRGSGGAPVAAPFYQFWFDDNWLARYVSEAYERAVPAGLHDNGYTLRWRPLGGDNRHWMPYESGGYPDRLALNGLFHLNRGDLAEAIADWRRILALSDPVYNPETQRFDYPGIGEVYHLGLWGILSERLLAGAVADHDRSEILQHSMAIRSSLLSLQERSPQGTRLGWRSGIKDPHSLINTETIAVAVLALGEGARWVLEPGHSPLSQQAGGFRLRSHHVLSAVPGVSSPGYMVFGPYWTLEPGTYDIEFSLRTPANSNTGALATVEVYDGSTIVAREEVVGTRMPGRNEWARVRLTARIARSDNSTEVRVYWHGNANLDVGPIRILERHDPDFVVSSQPVSIPIGRYRDAAATRSIAKAAEQRSRSWRRFRR